MPRGRAAIGALPPLGGVSRTSRWNALIIVIGCVILQYVWRIQEMVPALALVQFTAVVSVGAVLLFVADAHALRRAKFLRRGLFRLIAVILVLAILSVPTSIHDGASFHFLTGNFLKTVVLVGVLAAGIRDRADVDRLLAVFCAGGAIYLIAAILLAPPGTGRLGGGSYDPNDLGLFTVSTIPLCVYLMRRGAPWFHRILGAGAAMVLLTGTVLSGSRGGFLALMAAAAYALVALSAVRLSKRVMVIGLTVAVILVGAGSAYRDRLGTLLNPQEDYNWSGQAESGRIEVWKRGLGYMLRRPILGVGIDQFSVAEGTMAPQVEAGQTVGRGFKWSAAHNSYVQIGAELGVFGLVAFVTLLVLAFREARRIGRTALDGQGRLLGQAFGALIVAYAVGSTFLSQAYATYLYFALGLLIALSRVVDLERQEAALALMAERETPYVSAVPTPRAAVRGGRGIRMRGGLAR